MAVACGAQIMFPPLENPNFHCGHCLNAVYLCACCGVQHGKDYVLAGLPPLPSCPTAVERLVRWAAITSAHPGTSHFDARRFVRDMVDRNMLFTLAQERPRLAHMADDHARKLGEPSEASRLAALFAAGRLDGPSATQLAMLQHMCEAAMEKLAACDWADMSPLEVALCQNAFQTSDPAQFPLGDPGLQLVYDIIGVLTTVHRWAFSTRGWHLRLEVAPTSSATAPRQVPVDHNGVEPHMKRTSGRSPSCPRGSDGSMQHGWEQAGSPASHPGGGASHFVPNMSKDMSQDMTSQALDNNSVPTTPL